jgi:hypothetical protein
VFERLLPFELEVLQTRLKYWAGDSMGYLDALYALLMKCKIKSRQAKSEATISGMWKERGARVCLIIASQFLEMKVRYHTGSRFFFFAHEDSVCLAFLKF